MKKYLIETKRGACIVIQHNDLIDAIILAMNCYIDQDEEITKVELYNGPDKPINIGI